MKLISAVLLAASLLTNAQAGNPNPDAKQVAATHDLLQEMQAEKMMRMTAGMSHYASEAERKKVMDKVIATPSETIYTGLATPVARLLSPETVSEMTRFYQSSYGKKVLDNIYNSGAQLYPTVPKATPAEQAELKKPAYIKADREFKANDQAIHHEVFVLLKQIINPKK
ncbi:MULTISPECIES: hypothetical protein [unclassified Duganella]|uniref:hypothetical protein n=1 Tax=unclassified Duganella TaxID=2636909 RepID=UPI0006F8E71F|nr:MULTISPECIES: hypothetical protein [unclassified Duganella]KQV59718.1 hypothetical protein ASD07_23145 [Duganella sp. Root336D2]KRB87199.1 hypothetical protein ASE26_07345 [Duganella sp. Root198D2]